MLDLELESVRAEIASLLALNEINFETDGDGSFWFAEWSERCPVFVDLCVVRFDPVAQTTVRWNESDEQQSPVWFGIEASTPTLTDLGSIGNILDGFETPDRSAAVVTDEDDSKACIEFMLEGRWQANSSIDAIVAFFADMDDLLATAVEGGSEFSVDDEAQSPGFTEFALAVELDRHERFDEALEATLWALHEFGEAGLDKRRAVALITLAVLEARSLRSERAFTALDEAESIATDSEFPDVLELIEPMRFEVMVMLGLHDEAQLLQQSIALSPGSERISNHLLRQSTAVAEAHRGDASRLLNLAVEGQRRGSGSTLAQRATHTFNEGQIRIATGQIDAGLEQLERAARLYESTGLERGAQQARLAIAGCLTNLQRDRERVLEIFESVRTSGHLDDRDTKALFGFVAASLGFDPEKYGVRLEELTLEARAKIETAQLWAARPADDQGGMPQWNPHDVAERSTRIMKLINATNDEYHQGIVGGSVAQAMLASQLLHNATDATKTPIADMEETRSIALNALEQLEPIRSNRATAVQRRQWLDGFGPSYLSAIAAMASGPKPDPVAALELIEIVRSQTMRHDHRGSVDPAGDSESPPMVAVKNSSVVADALLRRRCNDIIALKDLVEAQAGSSAWYWTQWRWGPVIFSALMAPNGRVTLKGVAVAAQLPNLDGELPSQVTKKFVKSARSFADHHAGRPEAERLTPGEEFDLARELGEALIPLALKQALECASPARPIPLVFAPDWHVPAFPAGMLRVGDRFERVIELAVLQQAVPPKAAMFERSIPSTRLVTEIIDPDGDLAALGEVASGTAEDSTSGLVRFWQAAQRGEPLLFAGHGVPDDDGRRALKVGPLATDVVRTTDLLSRQAGAPSKAVLAGCATAGADDSAVSQGWDLAEALMACGSSEVVATQREIRANGVVVSMIQSLRDCLATGDALTESLRQIQIEFLHAARDKSGGVDARQEWIPWVSFRVNDAVPTSHYRGRDMASEGCQHA